MSNKTIMSVTLAATAVLAIALVPAASFAKATVKCEKDSKIHMVKTKKACKKLGGTVVKKASTTTTTTTEAAPATTTTTETPATTTTTTETPAS